MLLTWKKNRFSNETNWNLLTYTSENIFICPYSKSTCLLKYSLTSIPIFLSFVTSVCCVILIQYTVVAKLRNVTYGKLLSDGMITYFLCEDFNCWSCNVVQDKHDLNSNTNQDSILQSPKEASKKCCKSGNQIQLWKRSLKMNFVCIFTALNKMNNYLELPNMLWNYFFLIS